MHVLAHHAALVPLDEEHELALVVRRRDRCIRADDRVALLIKRCVFCAFRRTHDDERSDGRERSAAVRQLENEARGVVVVGLDCLQLQIEETLWIKCGLLFGLRFGCGRRRRCREGRGGTTEVDVGCETDESGATEVEREVGRGWLGVSGCRGGEWAC